MKDIKTASERNYVIVNSNTEESTIVCSSYNNIAIYKHLNYIPTTHQLKAEIKQLIEEYKDLYLNKFTYHGSEYWINGDKRIKLKHYIDCCKQKNIDTIELWLANNRPITIDINILEKFLVDLEIYAKEIYDITNKHKNNIDSLNRKEALEYNFQVKYPKQLDLKDEI